MALTQISAREARALMDQGAVLVDIRGSDERARLHVPGSASYALGSKGAILPEGRPLIFHCRSGNRTAANAELLLVAAGANAYALKDGIDGWVAAGLPVVEDKSQPIEIMRQVQIGAGTMVLAGVLLGSFLHPAWFGLAAFVGAGLTFAGVTGWCGMAKLLAFAPWNRRTAAGAIVQH